MKQFHNIFPHDRIVVPAIRQLSTSGIKVAEYLTELPDKTLLQEKLHAVIEMERKRIENL